REFLFLVGAEQPGVLVGADQIVIPCQEVGAVGQQLDRLMLPQRPIGRVGVGIEFARHFFDVEIRRQLSRIRIHAAILFGGDRYAVFALSQNASASTVPPRMVPPRNTVSPTDWKSKCMPAPTRLLKPRPPGRRIYLRFCSASMSVRCPTCRMPGI